MPNNVAAFRSKYKIKQKTLAEICGMTVQTYCNKEANVKAEFTRSEMNQLTEFFKKYEPEITMDELFFLPQSAS